MRFTWRDALATGLIGAAVAAEAAHLAGADAPGLSSGRALTGVLLGLGLGACIAGGTEMATLPIPYARFMSVMGAGAVVVGLAGLISGAFSMTAALTVAMAVMWAAATIRHAVRPVPRVTDEALHRLIESERHTVGPRG